MWRHQYAKVAHGEMSRPQPCLLYTSSVRSNQGRDAYASLSVEEYKRPTFYVEFDTISTKYQEGDTVTVSYTHLLEVMMIMVFLKFTVRPLLSVSLPSSNTCNKILKTSGCAFSISSNSTKLSGLRLTASVSCPT